MRDKGKDADGRVLIGVETIPGFLPVVVANAMEHDRLWKEAKE